MADLVFRLPFRLRGVLASAGTVCLTAFSASAVPIDPSSPTTGWTPISYPSLLPDVYDDERTGSPEADIVGNSSNPAFYYRFDNNGTPSTTDGAIAFRVRIGADKNPSGFDHFMGVGVDANGDGAIDIFLGVDNSGSPDRVGIYDAGTGANTSPSTTSINVAPLFSYALSVSNYNFSPVTATIDPPATSTDLDTDGNNDYLLTFVIPYSDMLAALAAQGVTGVNDTTSMRLVVGSSTQPNALNQDLGGPNGGTTSTQTWAALGALSDALSAAGGFPAPEPSTGLLVAFGLCGLGASRRRARR